PITDVEIRLSEQGEVLFRRPGVLLGYAKNPEARRETLEDGWIHSGDAGFLGQDGHLKIIDRARDVGRLADGTLFAPKFLENKLKFSPYVREVVCVGQTRPWVTALVNIDLAAVGNWAERRNIAYTSYTDLAQKPEVYELIQRVVERVNRRRGEPARAGAAAARGRRRQRAVRRPRRGQPGEPGHRPGGNSGDHRAQRRRQDDAAQRHQRVLPSVRGTDRVRLHRPNDAESPGRRRARHRPDLPERRPLQGHDRARQHHDRPPAEDAGELPAGSALLGPGPAPGAGASRLRGAHHRLSRDPGDPQDTGGPATVRAAETGRAGPGASRRAQAPAAR